MRVWGVVGSLTIISLHVYCRVRRWKNNWKSVNIGEVTGKSRSVDHSRGYIFDCCFSRCVHAWRISHTQNWERWSRPRPVGMGKCGLPTPINTLLPHMGCHIKLYRSMQKGMGAGKGSENLRNGGVADFARLSPTWIRITLPNAVVLGQTVQAY